MRIVHDKILLSELSVMSEKMFGRLVKVVVDVEKEIMVVGADLHVDEEQLLLEQGSQQKNIWGVNVYPGRLDAYHWIEFDSMINLRPSMGNRSRGVDDPQLQEKIRNIVNKLVVR